MDDILTRVQVLLERANRERVEIPASVLDEFAQACRDALQKEFSGPSDKFTIRMSNIGRPLCQLQLEAAGKPREGAGYNHRMNMLTGDLMEAALIAIMKTAGVNVQSQHQLVGLEIGGTLLEGTYDVEINGAIYDIKSASDYSFSNKFAVGYDAISGNDDFGYVAQGFGYSEAVGKPFGGWIAVNKETGEITVAHTPPRETQAYKTARENALETIAKNVTAIRSSAVFSRCFDDVDEQWYGKPTGNKILGRTCSWCDWKTDCWPGVTYRKQLASKAKSPRFLFYTSTKEDNEATDPGEG